MANVPPPPAGHVNRHVQPNNPAPDAPMNRNPNQPPEARKVKTGVAYILLQNAGWIPVESLNFTQNTEELNAPWLQLDEDEYAFVAMSENKMIVGRASAIIATKTRS